MVLFQYFFATYGRSFVSPTLGQGDETDSQVLASAASAVGFDEIIASDVTLGDGSITLRSRTTSHRDPYWNPYCSAVLHGPFNETDSSGVN